MSSRRPGPPDGEPSKQIDRTMHIHDLITKTEDLAALCARLAKSDFVTVDTEFMRENTFWPELCLVQIATRDELAVIDPYKAGDLTQFWRVLADGQHVTIVHAAREGSGRAKHPAAASRMACAGRLTCTSRHACSCSDRGT